MVSDRKSINSSGGFNKEHNQLIPKIMPCVLFPNKRPVAPGANKKLIIVNQGDDEVQQTKNRKDQPLTFVKD